MLTKRELEVLQLRKQGKTQAEIAAILKISQPAVSNFERNAQRKIAGAEDLLKHLKDLGLLLLLLCFAPLLAASVRADTPDPGHPASGIGAGTFGAGNYVFPAQLDVNGNLIVNTSMFFVNANSGLVGIGTIIPASALEVNGNISLSWGADRSIRVNTNSSGNGTNLTISAGAGSCFLAGTQVTMANGSTKSIEDIKIGEQVLSFDQITKEEITSKVINVYHHTSSEMMSNYYLIIRTEKGVEIKVTPNHRMYVNGEWKEAGTLTVDDKLLNDKNETDIVASIEKVYDKPLTYNLEIYQYHVYYAQGILVHNAKTTIGVLGGNLYLTAGGAINAGNGTGGNIYEYGGVSSGIGAVNGNVILANNGTTSIGNVGINTTQPNSTLHVSGTTNLTGTLFAGDVITGANGLTIQSGSVSLPANSIANAALQGNGGLTINTGNGLSGGNTINLGGSATISTNAATCSAGQYSYWNGSDWLCGAGSGNVTGNGTANYLSKYFNGTMLTNSLVYDSGTNVGIGTTAPADILSITAASGGITINATNSGGAAQINLISAGINQASIFRNPSGILGLRNAATGNAQLSIDTSGNVGIGTTSPGAALEVIGDIISAGTKWTNQTQATQPYIGYWYGATYGNGQYIIAGKSTTSSFIMTSPDGITWTNRTTATITGGVWRAVTYGNGQYIIAGNNASHSLVMTSPDGITWTNRTNTTITGGSWWAATYGNGQYIIAGKNSTDSLVMTSPDGITWTNQTTATITGTNSAWFAATYGNGQYIIAGRRNNTYSAVMTSPDGITWTNQTTATSTGGGAWYGATYGNGQYIIAGTNGTTGAVMTSPDGITWTNRTGAISSNTGWYGATYGNGLYIIEGVGVSYSPVMTSPDGITWTNRTTAAGAGGSPTWYAATYGNGAFIIAGIGSSNTPIAMTSGKTTANIIPTNNIQQGGLYVFDRLGINTVSANSTLHVIGSANITGPFYIPNSACSAGQALTTDASGLVSCTSVAGNITGGGIANYIARWTNSTNISTGMLYDTGLIVGIGTTSPTQKLDVNGSFIVENGTSAQSGSRAFFVNLSSSEVRIGDRNYTMNVLVNGTINATGAITQNSGFDVAEMFEATETMTPGDLVAIAGPNSVKKATTADADLVIGAVSTKPGFIMANPSLVNPAMIGLAGRIPVKITGAVQPGDFIAISSTPGVGEAATKAGFVIGRAIENSNNGEVTIIIQPTYFNPAVRADGTIVGGSANKKAFVDESAAALTAKTSIDPTLIQKEVQKALANQPADNNTNLTVEGSLQTDVITPQSGKDVVIQLG